MPNLAGKYLGRPVKAFINVLAVVLLLLVGVVFVASPAQLMGTITMDVFGAATSSISISNAEEIHQAAEAGGITVWGMDKATVISVWTAIIFIYYILATLLPVDKIYGLVSADLSSADPISFYRSVDGMSFEKFFQNFETRADLPLWPLLFLTISCGALSGFHATQSPLMARCTENEKEARFIFYGAMIGEGVIALVWCAVGLSFYDSLPDLLAAIKAGSPSKVVYDSSIHFLGLVGGIFAVLGVVVLPITSGDTAFRAARLVIAEFFNLEQKTLAKRLMIAVPLFTLGFIVSKIDFSILWRYFTWANQTTAMVMLWTAAAYLYRYNKFHWVCTIPAVFISTVCFTYLAYNKIGFGLDYQLSVYIGLGLTALCLVLFFTQLKPLGARDEEAYVNN